MNPDLLDHAKRVGTDAGCRSAKARGLDDWDAEALAVAEAAERAYLATHKEPSK